METLKRPLKYLYYYSQSDFVFLIDLINAIRYVFSMTCMSWY